jgi:ribonucleoside-diphosphate reductase alpha chain
MSVLVTDAFMAAARERAPWDLVFEGKVYRTVDAGDLWDRLMRATYAQAEPGVIFIDRVNAMNNLAYCETIHATNPCVTADTWVHTSEGPRQVADLVGRPFEARIDGQHHASGSEGFFRTATKAVVKLATVEGYALRLTTDHRVRVATRRVRDRVSWEWKPAGELAPGDHVMLSDHRHLAEWQGSYTFEEGYLLGLLIGDGTLKYDKAVLSVWLPAAAVGATAPASGVAGVMEAALAAARTLPHRSDFSGWQEVAGRGEQRLSLAALRWLALEAGMRPGQKAITPAMESASSAFCRGFLRGFFDADGSVQGSQAKGVSVRLAQSDLARLQAAQRMLHRLGIVSALYSNRRPPGSSLLPDSKGGWRTYATRAQHELVVSGANLERFAHVVGFSDTAKRKRLEQLLSAYRRASNVESFTARVLEITPDGQEDVFDVAVPGINAFDANGLVAHNCGEQPLPPFGACLLGSINLARLVKNGFNPGAGIDTAALEARVATAVRFLDNVIDVSNYPLREQRHEAVSKRRIGLGITGLADALILSGVRYGSSEAQALAGQWMRTIQNAAYAASAGIAAEKGAFPLYDREKMLERPNIRALAPATRDSIARHGLRNGCLTSIAPTGTISLLAGNVSSGAEPVFDFAYRRRLLERDGSTREETVEDWAHARFREHWGNDAPLPPAFVKASELTTHDHLAMLAALQPHVDSAISKTVNVPTDMPFEAFKSVYAEAHALGLKGCTTFRPNAITGSVLASAAASPAQAALPAEPARSDGARAEAGRERRRDLGGDVVYMAKPQERDAVLSGYTYKLKWPASDHAIYVTINDIERSPAGGGQGSGPAGGGQGSGPAGGGQGSGPAGGGQGSGPAGGGQGSGPAGGGQGSGSGAGGGPRRRPFEIFINTRNLEHYAWTVALTRMISAVFRRGGDVAFVAEELKAVFDPQGGEWIGGRYVPSLLAAIGEVIETHMIRTGALPPREAQAASATATPVALAAADEPRALAPGTEPGAPAPVPGSQAGQGRRSSPRLQACPRCQSTDFTRVEGCWVCRSCGYSRCG